MGDSLKRVNYKLSAKKDKLMIRLDEPSTMVRMAVVLDDTTSSDRYNDEIAIEGMMSYVGCLVKNKVTTDVYYNLDGKRKKMTISDDRDLMTFISEITQASFYFKGESKMENVKLEKVNNLSSVVVFSALGHIVKLASNIGIPYRIVTPNRHKKGQEVWYLDKNLNIIMGGVANGKIKNLFGDNLPAFLYGIIITIVTLILYIPNNYIVILIATAAVGILYIVLNRVNEKAKKRYVFHFIWWHF